MNIPTAPARSDFCFFDRLRVRWAEVDMQKIVFNGHYLLYFDTAIAAYWRAAALPYHETMQALQGDLYVRKATLDYEGSARYDDACDVGLRCARIGNSSMVFTAALFRGEQRLVHGEIVYVFADPATQTSRPVPAVLRAALDRFEAGRAMLDIEAASWPALATETTALRQTVWHQELGLPADAAADAADATATHVLARNRFGRGVGCGRLVVADGGLGEIGRLAVLHAVRGAGLGRTVLAALVAQARQQRLQTLRLQAPRAAVGFFTRAGFAVAHAEPVPLAGVPHVSMGLRLG